MEKLTDTCMLLSKLIGRKVNMFYEDLYRTDTQLSALGLNNNEIEKVQAIRQLIEHKIDDDIRNLRIRNDNDIIRIFRNTAYFDVECVYGLYLNNQRRVIRRKLLAKGSAFQVSVRPREIIGPAVALSATYLVLIHNHPTSTSKPSDLDIGFTHELLQALNYFDIGLLDHIIIAGNNKFWSMRESGILVQK